MVSKTTKSLTIDPSKNNSVSAGTIDKLELTITDDNPLNNSPSPAPKRQKASHLQLEATSSPLSSPTPGSNPKIVPKVPPSLQGAALAEINAATEPLVSSRHYSTQTTNKAHPAKEFGLRVRAKAEDAVEVSRAIGVKKLALLDAQRQCDDEKEEVCMRSGPVFHYHDEDGDVRGSNREVAEESELPGLLNLEAGKRRNGKRVASPSEGSGSEPSSSEESEDNGGSRKKDTKKTKKKHLTATKKKKINMQNLCELAIFGTEQGPTLQIPNKETAAVIDDNECAYFAAVLTDVCVVVIELMWLALLRKSWHQSSPTRTKAPSSLTPPEIPGLGDQQPSLTFVRFCQLSGFSLNPGFQQQLGFPNSIIPKDAAKQSKTTRKVFLSGWQEKNSSQYVCQMVIISDDKDEVKPIKATRKPKLIVDPSDPTSLSFKALPEFIKSVFDSMLMSSIFEIYSAEADLWDLDQGDDLFLAIIKKLVLMISPDEHHKIDKKSCIYALARQHLHEWHRDFQTAATKIMTADIAKIFKSETCKTKAEKREVVAKIAVFAQEAMEDEGRAFWGEPDPKDPKGRPRAYQSKYILATFAIHLKQIKGSLMPEESCVAVRAFALSIVAVQQAFEMFYTVSDPDSGRI
ncbi:hypothetical protein JAAARDRAFT_195743 [Jaapia argillacea MUCL 33604]|uniref:Uncharacterized protein n=1 Tax=Jaapia argillacea MUCL 33604 TaxID=933084 RepID=A0A067PKI4_9AGAM|nr:hypothetical protein JAAARDRAFT_195743 [Jaapia argillacea MUCL 33604]